MVATKTRRTMNNILAYGISRTPKTVRVSQGHSQLAGNQLLALCTGNGCLRESSGIQAFRLGPGSDPYVGYINTRFAQAKIINLTMMCNKILSG